jgi:hypothetical protein
MKRRQTPCLALPVRARLEAYVPFMMTPSDAPVWSPSVRERWRGRVMIVVLHDTDLSAHGLRGPEKRRWAEPGRIRGGHAEGITRHTMRGAG